MSSNQNQPFQATGSAFDISALDQERMLRLAIEMSQRKQAAIRLYRPRLETEAFHRSKSWVRLIRGGNRAGKSITVATEIAAHATGIPIIGVDGKEIPLRSPPGRPLDIWVIGFDLKHIGQTIHRLLFKPNLFRLIKDEQTGMLRSWRPWIVTDADREDETVPSPPLIPERLVDPNGWAWENKADNTFSVCRLLNGTNIFAFGSGSVAKQGDPVDAIWIDEDVQYPAHVSEWLMRLADRKGWMVWSAMPHERNDKLVDFSNQAAIEADKPEPLVHETQLTFSGNPYIDTEQKRKHLALLNDDERRRRDLGDFNKYGRLVFPQFNDAIHGMDMSEYMERYRQGAGWCRYMAVDPGWARLAVTFWAVPPPSVQPSYFLLEDEIYLEKGNSEEFGRLVAAKTCARVYQSFIIDWHGSRIHEMGSGMTVMAQYSSALAGFNVRSISTGSDFERGSADREYRVLCFRQWLEQDPATLTSRFRFIRDTTPNFQKEIVRYRRKMTRDLILDEPDDSQWSHLMVTCQYFAAAMSVPGRVAYRPPPMKRNKPLTSMEHYLEQKRNRKNKGKKAYVNMGPTEADQYTFM